MGNRQFVKVKFRPEDSRLYTYHNDGEPVHAGDVVKVPDNKSSAWKRVTVVEVSELKPQFETKPILGLAPPPEEPHG